MARRAGHSPIPPPLEMACLGVLWTLGSGTVRDVAEALAPRHSLAYTTVMTLLDRLVKRGHLEREKAGRSFVYSPAQTPERLREIAVDGFVQDFFGGSREALAEWLAGGRGAARVQTVAAGETIDTALL